MSKIIKPFVYEIPVTRETKVNGKKQFAHIGTITVMAQGYKYPNESDPELMYGFDYDAIIWNDGNKSMDIYPLLENFYGEDALQALYDLTFKQTLFQFDQPEPEPEVSAFNQDSLFEEVCGLNSIAIKSFYGI